jgi:hypothetical protein
VLSVVVPDKLNRPALHIVQQEAPAIRTSYLGIDVAELISDFVSSFIHMKQS